MKNSIFLSMFIFVLIGASSACGSNRTINSGAVNPTQVELARQRLVAQLATNASPTQHAQNNIQAPSEPLMDVGSISGTLSYPSEFIPAQVIVAFKQDDSEYYMITTSQGQGTYQIDNILPGTYHVIAYVNDMSAGYSQAVPCGLRVECDDHSLIDVVVLSGNLTTNIDPSDWFAPPGTFPPQP